MATATASKTRKQVAKKGRAASRRNDEPSEAELQAYLADIDRRMAENERRLDELLIKLEAKPAA
jgi:uncharacterized protein YceH (UPF0502 family)